MNNSTFGLINLNKPSGITSRDAVNRIQAWVRPVKVGHAGTLDPLANGVLLITLGPATRLTEHLQSWPKSYRATFLLGRQSDTEDVEGTVIAAENPTVPSSAELDACLPALTGTIQQTPPAYSALKIRGKRAYALARSGRTVQLQARTIVVHRLEIIRYEYPELELAVQCGSGTYIRSLGRDLAQAAGTTAVMSALTRTAIGHLTLAKAVRLDELDAANLAAHLLPATEAVCDLPSWTLTSPQVQDVAHGKEIICTGLDAAEVAAVTTDGQLAAILTRRGNQRYRPQRNFIAAG